MDSMLSKLKIATLVSATMVLYVFFLIGRIISLNSLRWRRFIYRTWARLFVRLMRVKIDVVGTPPTPPFFLVTNHTGYVDVPTLRVIVEGVFVAKHEIASWPIVGGIIGNMGNIYINRQNRRDIPRAGTEVIERLQAGEGVIVFPEGTTSNGQQILPFNSSFLEFAARAEIPVHYASITYKTKDGMPPASTSVAWWDDTPLTFHMTRLFSMKGFQATVRFGEGPVTSDDRKQLARELEASMRDSFTPFD